MTLWVGVRLIELKPAASNPDRYSLTDSAPAKVLTPEDIRRICCDSTISRIVFGPAGEPVDIGRTTRVVPAAMRRAVIARDRHCTHPGCDRPARWCDIHHIWHWTDGGPTALWNLKLLRLSHESL